MKIILICFALFFTVATCRANVIINTTRVIYPAEQKEVSVQLLNKGELPALVQAWIDDGQADSTPETAHVPFQLTPPVSKIAGQNGQQLRIRTLDNALPRDRESVFYLNVLDIPPLPENTANASLMQVAIKSRIKLFYRPQGLGKPAADTQLTVTSVAPDVVQLTNTGPFFITVIGLKNSKQQALISEGIMLAPFARQRVTLKSALSGKALQLMTIDDFGAWQSTPINIH